MPQGDG